MATLTVGASGVYSTIQAAVNAANDGDTIVVGTGTYVEQVVVDGIDNLTIEALLGAGHDPGACRPRRDRTLDRRPRDHAVFTVINSANVVLEGIDIDGAGAGNSVDEGRRAGQANFYGIFYRDSSGGLSTSTSTMSATS